MNAMNNLKSALGFMTILPLTGQAKWSPSEMIKYFPVVGLILGTLMFVFDMLVSLVFPASVASLLDVIFLVCMTGAFHIDGLGDTADGVFSHRPRDRVMEIMKDSRIGMMGLVTVVSVLAMKTAGIYSLKLSDQGVSLFFFFLVIPAYARGAMIFGIRFLKYGRKGTGTGLDFFKRPIGQKDFSFLMIPLGISFIIGLKGIILTLVFIFGLSLILLFYKKKLNCITGDMLGALTEIMETVLFLAAGAAIL